MFAVCNASVPLAEPELEISVLAGETPAVQTAFQSLQQICRTPESFAIFDRFVLTYL